MRPNVKWNTLFAHYVIEYIIFHTQSLSISKPDLSRAKQAGRQTEVKPMSTTAMYNEIQAGLKRGNGLRSPRWSRLLERHLVGLGPRCWCGPMGLRVEDFLGQRWTRRWPRRR